METLLRRSTPILLVALPAPALAAGGAHVVDDSAVETSGHRHVESWGTAGSDRLRLGNADIACSPATLPQLEIGAFVIRSRSGGQAETAFGLAPKISLRDAAAGLASASSAASRWRRRIAVTQQVRSPCR